MNILKEELKLGLNLAQTVSQCPDILDCLWGKPKRCNKKCGLALFRKAFESDSPAFFGLFLRISQCRAILDDLARMEMEGDPEQKHEAREKFHDLQTFAYVSIFALYSLYLVNNEDVPYLTVKEIKEVEEHYLEIEPLEAEKELEEINSEWYHWIAAVSTNFCDAEKYAKKLYLIIKIFLRGVEKYGPPVEFASEKERENFFEKVQEFLCSQAK